MSIAKLPLIIVLFSFFSCKERIFRAPSGGMERTIMAGDVFEVTPADKFERNDIVVFNYFGPDYTEGADEDGKYPMHHEKRMYRLIAYSGDSLEIRDGEVFLNSRHVPLPPKAVMKYEVVSKGHIDEFDEKDPYINTTTKTGDTISYIVDLTTEQAFDYRQSKPAIISVRKKSPDSRVDDTSYARASVAGQWTSDNYGPLRIPSPGETIYCDKVNFKFYHNIPGIKTGKFLLKEKLYFVLGDNRHGAEDSRFIGLVPHSKMYGVVK